MLKNPLAPFWLTLLLLAGCSPSAPQPKPTATAPGKDYLAAINKLPPKQRDLTFYRAIEDADFICESVVASQAQGAIEGHPAWDARCSDGQHWTLVLLDGGLLQVLKGSPASSNRAGASTNAM